VAKRKSLAQQLLEAQQRKAKEKADREKAAHAAALKAQAAAAREHAARVRRAEREAAEAARREQAADAKAVAQVLREMGQREVRREAEEAKAAKAKERQVAEDARLAKARELQTLKDEALEDTRTVEARVAAIGSILSDRDRDLHGWRGRTDAAFRRGDPTAYADYVAEVLSKLAFLSRARVQAQVAYAPESRRLTVLIDLPRKERIPAQKAFRYVAARREIVAEPRKPAEIQQIYQDAIARFTLCVADYTAAITSPELVEEIAINGHVRTTDPATGQPVNPCLVTFLAEREQFEQLLLDEPGLDPVRCLHHLQARVSPNPYDLEAVTPIVNFDLERFKLVDEAGALAGLDSRTDLMAISPYEFEQLIQKLFLAMGYQSWRTQNSRDDGVDAVAVRDDIAIGGVCVIQAKRTKNTVGVEVVRALFGTMAEKKAYTGLVVTTSKFGAASHAFAKEVGRISLIEGRYLKSLLQEHLQMDVLISIPQTPARRTRAEISPTAAPGQTVVPGEDANGA
jgi:restriction system protein